MINEGFKYGPSSNTCLKNGARTDWEMQLEAANGNTMDVQATANGDAERWSADLPENKL